MSQPIVDVENISKRYVLGQPRLASLRESFERSWRHLFGHAENGVPKRAFWALKDVSFSVEKGEIIGIIGRNGAGKSTLLKILSKITDPTEGRAVLRGRVSSLLEVGTGFHPELTGKENIYLNGAILGMRKKEINRKLDEIIAFAEIEEFIETPVKHYSSGMYVRLAFAVAAHLEPEILLVDEVLAVGDLMFQKKCIGKMGDIAKEGRTVLFVSHNLPAVMRLCSKGLLLTGGKVTQHGQVGSVVQNYLQFDLDTGTGLKQWSMAATGGGIFTPISMRVLGPENNITNRVSSSMGFDVELEYRLKKNVPAGFRAGILVSSCQGDLIFCSWDSDIQQGEWIKGRSSGHYVSRGHVPAHFLNTGDFLLGLNAGIFNVESFFTDEACMVIKVEDRGDSIGSHWNEKRGGTVRPDLNWSIKNLS